MPGLPISSNHFDSSLKSKEMAVANAVFGEQVVANSGSHALVSAVVKLASALNVRHSELLPSITDII